MTRPNQIRSLIVALLLACSLFATSRTAEATFSHSNNNYNAKNFEKLLLYLKKQVYNYKKGGSKDNGITPIPEVPAALPVAVALMVAAGASHLCRRKKIGV
jgi:tRNA U38,U39,U40 pseudouridine synthase TruA